MRICFDCKTVHGSDSIKVCPVCQSTNLVIHYPSSTDSPASTSLEAYRKLNRAAVHRLILHWLSQQPEGMGTIRQFNDALIGGDISGTSPRWRELCKIHVIRRLKRKDTNETTGKRAYLFQLSPNLARAFKDPTFAADFTELSNLEDGIAAIRRCLRDLESSWRKKQQRIALRAEIAYGTGVPKGD